MTYRLFGMSLILVVAIACGPLHPRIIVDFDTAPDLRGGEVVLLGGQPIGRTETPYIRDGVVEVRVLLDDRRAVPRDTLFLADVAENGRPVLVAFPRGPTLEIQLGSPPPHFKGVASRGQLAAVVAGDGLRAVRGWLDEVLAGALRSTTK